MLNGSAVSLSQYRRRQQAQENPRVLFHPEAGPLSLAVYTRKKTGAMPVRVLKVSGKVPHATPRFDFFSTLRPVSREGIGPAFERARASAIKSAP